jgi:sec-independent protein translocase protein TatB
MNLGFPEMLFLFVLALIIFGPKKLPEIGRQIGKGLAEFKRASNEFQAQIQDEVRKLELDDVKNSIAPISLENTVSYSSSSYTSPTPVAAPSPPGTETGIESSANSGTSLNGHGAPEEPTNRANA